MNLKPKLIVLRGLPSSGKSTYACQLVQQMSYKRLNKDDLRLMINNGNFDSRKEHFIHEAMFNLIELALSNNLSVISDNINFSNKDIKRYKLISEWYKADLEIIDFDIPVEVCIERDLNRPDRVGQEVIMKLYKKYYIEGKYPKVEL